MDHNHKKEEVGKLIEEFDNVYESFFKCEESLLVSIDKLEELTYGAEQNEKMISDDNDPIVITSLQLNV